MVLLIHDSLLIPSYFPRCHPLSPPRTPHVTPPTPVGPSTPPAAPKQVSHRRFCLWSAPNPASAPRCSPLFVASPQYTLNPRSAVGRDPRRPPMPEFPAVSFSEPCAFGLPFSAFPRLGKLDFPLMHGRFPQPACVASAPRAFRISAASIPHAPNKPAKALAKARSRHHIPPTLKILSPGSSSPQLPSHSPVRAHPHQPLPCLLPLPLYPSDSDDSALRELFPDEDESAFDAIPATVVEAVIEDIQGRFETILSASVLPPALRRSTYAAFLSDLRDLRRHRLQVMAVFNPRSANYPDGNGDDPAPGSGSS
ncbi:hypothetical protein PGT21_021393 [Puccinia graminis f. sp. tritici]|uniref:Uncharacterized protein n=1 Tax=Puccinia graminis f. sp. tritici TaxID=56615 RepID=A0A5B0QFS5_PUCGR|nr:hypothetical protein PGT21_021393 [Puccinia graminis f. sp. tritici]